MKTTLKGQILSIILVFILVSTLFFGININAGNTNKTPRSKNQPYNSFKEYLWGGVGEDEAAQYGWNITYIENLNNDAYPDLVIGAPHQKIGTEEDVGAVYIFFGQASTGFSELNFSSADVRIRGEGLGNRFGWDVADAGDVNGDGVNDLLVGAPGIQNGRGRAYIFYGGGNLPPNAQNADRKLDGMKLGFDINSFYGTAVSGAGDVNNDGYDDVIVGAPGVSQTIISYGYKDLIISYPNIWDDDPSSVGVIDFNNGCNNTVNDTNTWGLGAGDDGWDWIDNVADPDDLYGGDDVNDGGTHYTPWEDDGPDADGLTYNNRSELEIMVGRNHSGENCPYGGGWGSPGGSAAYGIEFNITTEMLNVISSNNSLKVSFDYWAQDCEGFFSTGDDTEEACTIRSRIWNGSNARDRHYIGTMTVNNNLYVTYNRGSNGNPWGPVSGSFEYDISDYITHAGSYYWDFGCYVGNGRFGGSEGIIAFFDDVGMVLSNERHIVIQGVEGSGFGSSLESVGDLNGDNFDDFMIGSPYLDGGHVALFNGKQRFKTIEHESIAALFLTGRNVGDRFGLSISMAGDVDNDGISDVIIGAPGGDYANLYYAATLNDGPLVPNLWEKTEERGTPIVEFDAGLDTTGNTPGITGADDGWEVYDGAYGTGGSAGSSTRYNGANTIDPAQIAIDNELIIGIGDDFGDSAKPDSGAYGIEFGVDSEMYNAILAGGDVVVSYDWELDDTGLDAGEDAFIKTCIRKSATDINFLGWNLDTAGANEVFYMNDPDDENGFFIQGCSALFNKTGSYYVDFGVYVLPWQSQWGGENAIVHFDNFGLYITPPPDKKFIGTAGSRFGTSVGYVDYLDIDNNGDIIIGAPYEDSPNGAESGAVYGFFMDPSSERIIYAKNAEYLHYGENANDNFGWSLTGAQSVNTDQFGEIAVGAVNYDYAGDTDIGRIYLLSVNNVPRIRLLYPLGGENLNGTVIVNATVVDPDENIDTSLGIEFSYSTNLLDWEVIGIDSTPEPSDGTFEIEWNTSALSDGNHYFVKAWVQDLELNKGENISLVLTIDNVHEPSINIQTPEVGETVQGKIDLKATVKDSILDTIGGGMDLVKGIEFYLSDNNIDWELLSTQTKNLKGKPDVYGTTLNTKEYPDGEYWLRVNATDRDGFEIHKTINITIDNPARRPSIYIIPPHKELYQELKDTVTISATAFDFDGDINGTGVTFYVSSDITPYKWVELGSDSEPIVNTTGAEIFSISWDTTTYKDDWYLFKAFVNDTTGMTNESISDPFIIHNSDQNPPFIELIAPEEGRIVEPTQVITARVRDPDGDIDPNGVFYYFSKDKLIWQTIGNTPEPSLVPELPPFDDYDYFWSTDLLEDGEYYLNVTVTDTSGLTSWDTLDEPIIIHNYHLNPPKVNILKPTLGININGTYKVQAYAFDLENNIDNAGVTFSASMDISDPEAWRTIESVPYPIEGTRIYELAWDTTQNNFNDGKYWLRAQVTDTDGLSAEAVSDYFYIHNNMNNPPTVKLLWPHSGEVNGTIKINSSVFDLENNIMDTGVTFEYSLDKKTWTFIGNDPAGREVGTDIIYEFNWDTTTVSDNMYWLRVKAIDLTSLEGIDVSDSFIIVHNNVNNRPILKFVAPTGTDPLSKRESIVAEVIDFENDVVSVSFLYSKDNKSWKLVDTKQKPETANIYRTIWITEDITNGEYHLKIKATDATGNIAELISGPFEVTQGVAEEKKEETSSIDDLLWIIIIIIIVVVMLLVVVLMLRRSKKREEELIEEVAAEAQKSQVMEGEIIGGPGMYGAETQPQMAASVEGGGSPDALQTYIPPEDQQGTLGTQATMPQLPAFEADVETIESYKAQMATWKAEGYNVSRLEGLSITDEDMFAKAFPVYSSNITRLKNISTKLDTIDSTGYETEIANIRSKLFEPDSAIATEQDFNFLQSTIMSSAPGAADGPGTMPVEEEIDNILPQLLPGEQPPEQGAEQQTQTSSTNTDTGVVPPVSEQEPVTAADVPPEVELPPEPNVSIPGSETEHQTEPTTQDSVSKEKKDETEQ